MSQLNGVVQRVISVLDLTGAVVTNLTAANFVFSLRRRDNSALIATPEAVTVQSMGGGDYWVAFTPTQAATLYVLKVTPVSSQHVINPDQWQVEVEAASSSTAGPYLTTRANVKAAFDVGGTVQDAQIDLLLPQVTMMFQRRAGWNYFAASVTEYPDIESRRPCILFPDLPPVNAVTSLHISQGVPHVYDATTQLIEGTDFVVSGDGRRIELVVPRCIYGPLARSIKLVYDGGYSLVHEDLRRAAEEILITKLKKSENQGVYHLAGYTTGEGSMSGLRWDDIPIDALATFDLYARRLIV
jgi:hypothetical protein